jgi:hypothetical protein
LTIGLTDRKGDILTKLITLGGKRANGKSAIVDDDMYEVLSKHNWWCNSDGYAIRIEYKDRRYYRQIFMHKEILKVEKGLQVDHINRNILDNRRSNLRPATPSQNQVNRVALSNNTSGFKGVSFDTKGNKWRAYLIKDGEQMNLGFYTSKEDAAKAYNIKAVELFGEFALLNDVDHTGFKLNTRERYSEYRGVSFDKRHSKWTSTIIINGKNKHLGRFDSEHDAARMYNFWAIDLFGDNARLNVINEGETK